MQIERVGEHYAEDLAVSMALTNLVDELDHYFAKKNRPYARALLRHAARHSDLYRRSGYSFHDAWFYGHKTDKKGNLVDVSVRFGPVPTDAQIEAFESRESRRITSSTVLPSNPRATQTTAKKKGVK